MGGLHMDYLSERKEYETKSKTKRDGGHEFSPLSRPGTSCHGRFYRPGKLGIQHCRRIMGEKLLLNKAAKIAVEDIVQKVMDIFEAEDGRVFEEKKKEVIEYLKNQEDTLLAERVLSAAINDEKGRCWKEKFWQAGETLQSNGHVILRKVKETDREMFLELQRETSMMRSMLKEEGYRLMLWDEHIQDKALMATIEVDDEYAGYCGINNLSKEYWEIAIELREKWRRQGIGYNALTGSLPL